MRSELHYRLRQRSSNLSYLTFQAHGNNSIFNYELTSNVTNMNIKVQNILIYSKIILKTKYNILNMDSNPGSSALCVGVLLPDKSYEPNSLFLI